MKNLISSFLKEIKLRFPGLLKWALKQKYNLLLLYQWLYIKRLRYKKKINVVFFPMSISMWRYQHFYELLSKHPKFDVKIVIAPSVTYSEEQQKKDATALMEYFNKKGIPFLLGTNNDGSCLDVKNELKPDILFYTQPYVGCINAEFDYNKFYNKVLCYTPYAFWRSKDSWSYDLPLHRRAWKLFYSTELHRKDAEEFAYNKGRNIEIVGYPTTDDFLSGKHVDIWKPQETKKKRIIWAPHFTIFTGGLLKQSNFIWMAEIMLDIAKKYSDRLQFVFKPHPRLYTELCKHEEWGEERAKEYYNSWATMSNTQLETGEFVDLFMTSDAMIHDSGSFCVEYHYSGNPVMYIADNFEEQVSEMALFGQLAMQQHYVGNSKEDIIDFIENTIIKGNDPMKLQRLQFVKEYLLPPNGKSVAQNMMDVFLNTFC